MIDYDKKLEPSEEDPGKETEKKKMRVKPYDSLGRPLKAKSEESSLEFYYKLLKGEPNKNYPDPVENKKYLNSLFKAFETALGTNILEKFTVEYQEDQAKTVRPQAFP